MEKLTKGQKNLIAIIIIITVCVLFWHIGDKMRRYTWNNGVYSIMTVDREGGRSVRFYYYYKGKKHYGGGGVFNRKLGDRFFVMLVPNDPNNSAGTDIRVPDWFTLDAPPEGWFSLPTSAELRRMMVVDSISRGLKVDSCGVYTIMTIAHIYGLTSEYHYSYQGQQHKGQGNGYAKAVGDRYFLLLLPPDSTLQLNRVPEWFTLEPPRDAWRQAPTEANLHKLMGADSVARGLKQNND